MKRWIAVAAASAAADLADWQRALAGKPDVAFGNLADLNHLLVEVREGWVSPSAIEAVAAGLSR